MAKCSVGQKLRHFRELQGLSQRAFAKKAGLTQATISHFESDQRIPSGQALLNMIKAFDISLDKLFCDE